MAVNNGFTSGRVIMSQKIIIDTDPGIDDTMAIFFALNSPEIDVLGLTTVYGNTSTEKGTINALRILEIASRTDIPVYAGAIKPLESEYTGKGEFVHGHDGQGNTNLELPKTKTSTGLAVDFLENAIKENPGEIILVPIGPLTNIAELLTRNPKIAKDIKEIILMGGNALSQGNASPSAEANIRNDPEAADIVFSADCEISMVGLDVTNQVFMDMGDIDKIVNFDSPQARHLKRIFPFYVNFLSEFFGKEGMPTHDSSAIAYLIDRSLFETIQYPIVVETLGISRGKTWMGTGMDKTNDNPWKNRRDVNICIEVDSEKVIELIKERVGS
tara:strand:- start:1731 stop:2717 length:987 start_codon:yes stop_codon:yes gene_type:complete